MADMSLFIRSDLNFSMNLIKMNRFHTRKQEEVPGNSNIMDFQIQIKLTT